MSEVNRTFTVTAVDPKSFTDKRSGTQKTYKVIKGSDGSSSAVFDEKLFDSFPVGKSVSVKVQVNASGKEKIVAVNAAKAEEVGPNEYNISNALGIAANIVINHSVYAALDAEELVMEKIKEVTLKVLSVRESVKETLLAQEDEVDPEADFQ